MTQIEEEIEENGDIQIDDDNIRPLLEEWVSSGKAKEESFVIWLNHNTEMHK
jgi:regulator of replication initiation timing